MRRVFSILLLTILWSLGSCGLLNEHHPEQDRTLFTRIGEIELTGGETAAEVSAYDPRTKKLFVINATKAGIDVINMEDPFNLVFESTIFVDAYGSNVNSVSVKHGLLAAAVEAEPRTAPGKVVVWSTLDLSERAVVTVGPLPDMLTFSPDGRFIVSANEGEPNEDYTIDPAGSVSIIRLPGFGVSTLDFSSFESQAELLKAQGFRLPGPAGTTLAGDTEPEYVAVSHDSRTAWVTLQENNAVAVVDLNRMRIEKILPLGFKDHSLSQNIMDVSDRDAGPAARPWPVKGMYLPDGIAPLHTAGRAMFITANEGDSQLRPTSDDALPALEEGDLFNEEARVKDLELDLARFPNRAELQLDANLGRLKVTNTLGDTDGDGDFDELYSFGTRSFTIRDGNNGAIIYESGSKLDEFLLQVAPSRYDDGRSDDKGVEPESVVTGKVGPRTLAFVGLERADAVVVIDVSIPASPHYLQVLETGDAPEGLLFIPANESPVRKPLLVTSCEGDGTIQVFALSSEEVL